jgi:hypothetical protein
MDNRAIFKNIFGKEFSDEGKKEMLEKITSEYPWFAPAQFYLLQKTIGTDAFKDHAIKTEVLFNNPWWLNFQLQQTSKEINVIPVAVSTNIEMNENKPSKEEQLLFEPAHMVDYFASQGIKLSETEQGTDKLGKQLKSFTEWLKTMKKLPSAAVDQSIQMAAPAESAVQAMAEKSNQEDEVVTESMAEVLARQGKVSRAIAVYDKLSLMNPSKSAYFAAKIQHLKES